MRCIPATHLQAAANGVVQVALCSPALHTVERAWHAPQGTELCLRAGDHAGAVGRRFLCAGAHLWPGALETASIILHGLWLQYIYRCQCPLMPSIARYVVKVAVVDTHYVGKDTCSDDCCGAGLPENHAQMLWKSGLFGWRTSVNGSVLMMSCMWVLLR